MLQDKYLNPIDYLMIGHLTIDRTAKGRQIGGTAAYSALTVSKLGLRVGIYTAWGEEVTFPDLEAVQIKNIGAEKSTMFENISRGEVRVQRVFQTAPDLDGSLIPRAWRSAKIVHLGPVAREVDPGIVAEFPSALIGMTPQGWLREWDGDGWVRLIEWPHAGSVLKDAGAVVISLEDLSGDEEKLEELVGICQVLAVTEGKKGVRLYWNGDVRRFKPPELKEVDTTGAGDIFAAAFFTRLYSTRDPWEAARFASNLAAYSVTRQGLDSIPTPEEIATSMTEIL